MSRQKHVFFLWLAIGNDLIAFAALRGRLAGLRRCGPAKRTIGRGATASQQTGQRRAATGILL
jgi:hypothetical protein